MGITEQGILGERWLLKLFKTRRVPCFQPDGISFENNEYVLTEFKNQEMYEAPPFNGHGLPRWQVEARMDFYKKTGIRCRLMVKDKGTKNIYWQYLDILEASEYIDTKGKKPRRIYNIDNFRCFHDPL